MDLKGLGNRLEYKLKTPSTFHASASSPRILQVFLISFSLSQSFCISLSSSWNPVFKFLHPTNHGFILSPLKYDILVATGISIQIPNFQRTCSILFSQTFKSGPVNCTGSQGHIREMVARGSLTFQVGSGCPEGRIL